MIVLYRDAENITMLSKNWMTTMGEWELLDITSHHSEGDIQGNYIDELVFHVSVCHFHNLALN